MANLPETVQAAGAERTPEWPKSCSTRIPNRSAPKEGIASVEITTKIQTATVPLRTAEEFMSWVMPHLPAITRLAARLAPAEDRDDVIQEALVRAWRKRFQFDPNRGSPSAWLLAITADQARKSRGRQRSHIPLFDLQAHVRSIDATLDLEQAISTLSKRQRLAVDCYYYAGLSVTETAAVMHCSEGTVKSTLSDARLRLRTMLEVD